MQLDDRKKRILQAIISDYIETAEPVGSRTIAKKHMQDLSSATIRNEMADLEEMGFLQHPHTSAGRVPSDLGYRLFVDSLMNRYKLTRVEMETMKTAMYKKQQELERLIAKASEILSQLTRYTAIAMMPELRGTSIYSFQVMPVDERRLLVVLVINDGIIKSRLIMTGMVIDPETAREMSAVLNARLAGLSMEEITLAVINEIKKLYRNYTDLINEIMEFTAEVISEMDSHSMMVEGAGNLLRFPEYADIARARDMMSFIENKSNIKNLITQGSSSVTVMIGSENPHLNMHHCSIVMCNYKVGSSTGSFGVIGPTRMDYAKVVSTLEFLAAECDREIKRIAGGDYE